MARMCLCAHTTRSVRSSPRSSCNHQRRNISFLNNLLGASHRDHLRQVCSFQHQLCLYYRFSLFTSAGPHFSVRRSINNAISGCGWLSVIRMTQLRLLEEARLARCLPGLSLNSLTMFTRGQIRCIILRGWLTILSYTLRNKTSLAFMSYEEQLNVLEVVSLCTIFYSVCLSPPSPYCLESSFRMCGGVTKVRK